MKKALQILVSIAGLSLTMLAFGQQSSQTPPKKVKVSQGVMEGALIHKVEPQYPEEAKAKNIQGNVVLHVEVGRDGHASFVVQARRSHLRPMNLRFQEMNLHTSGQPPRLH